MEQLDFEHIYNAFKEKVWRLAARYCQGQSDREDLFQEIFLRVHGALPKFRQEADPGTWIYRIAVNTAIDHLKRLKREQALKGILSKLRLVETVAGPEERLSLPDLKILDKLNARQRTIFVLAELEELKLEEIGAIMKLPVGTVKSNLHRAKELLKKELPRDEEL